MKFLFLTLAAISIASPCFAATQHQCVLQNRDLCGKWISTMLPRDVIHVYGDYLRWDDGGHAKCKILRETHVDLPHHPSVPFSYLECWQLVKAKDNWSDHRDVIDHQFFTLRAYCTGGFHKLRVAMSENGHPAYDIQFIRKDGSCPPDGPYE